MTRSYIFRNCVYGPRRPHASLRGRERHIWAKAFTFYQTPCELYLLTLSTHCCRSGQGLFADRSYTVEESPVR